MTKIEWAERTWNPVTGCTRVSPGCENCYAETMSHRLNAMGQEKYRGITKNSGKWSGKIRLHEDVLEHPLKWKKPAKIFVCSMSDLFHEDVPEEFIKQIFDAMYGCPQHIFMVLTKRAERMADLLGGAAWWAGTIEKYRAHIWLGTSIEDQQRADERIPELLKIPAAVRFLSVEPLLAPVDLSTDKLLSYLDLRPLGPLPGIHWVIAGGESGNKARPCHLNWLRSIRDQCATANVPFFLKQLGSNPWDAAVYKTRPLKNTAGKGKHGGDLALLDGRLHHEWPEGKK